MKNAVPFGSGRCLATVLIVVLLCSGCNNSGGKESAKKENPSTVPPQRQTERGPATDTLVIDGPAAVFFTPGSLHRRQLKAQFTEAQYDGVDHECFYQMKNARTSLKEHWPQIRIYEVTDTLYLQFVKEDGRRSGIDLTKKSDMCGLYIFNRKNDPAIADMMSIGTSLENYFIR